MTENQNLPSFDIGDHFNVLTRTISQNLRLFALIAVVAAACNVGASLAFGGASFAYGLISSIVYVLLGPVAIMSAYDAHLGRTLRTGDYFNISIRLFFYALIVLIVQALLISVGLFLLIVPGLYIAAMLYVTLPALVIERQGFSAFGRSLELSKGYRWPIVLVALVVFLLMMMVAFVWDLLVGISQLSGLPIVGPALEAFSSAFLVLIPTISSALVYWRLVEHKEGRSLTDIADVFA